MKFLSFKILLISTFIMGVITPMNFAHAVLQENYDDETTPSTLGSCNPLESFNMNLIDDDSNIEQFILTVDENVQPAKQITHSDFYNAKGIQLKMDFKLYEPFYKDEYSFILGSESNSNSDYKYSDDYLLDLNNPKEDRKVRILPESFFDVTERDGMFNADDKIELELIHDGEKNIMYLRQDEKGKYGIEEGECKDKHLEWKSEKALPKLKAQIKLSIPLKFNGPVYATTTVDGKDIITNEKSSNYKREIIDRVIATINISDGSMTFDNGLPTKTYDIHQEKVVEEDVKRKAIGFGGYGFSLPEKGDYKGISTEDSLEQMIIGITNFVLGFVSIIAVLMLIYGGYLWILDRGEEQLAEKSKKIIASAIIGILLIISAYTIVNTILDMKDPYESTCGIGLDIASGDHSLDAECTFEGEKAVTAGIGSLVGGVAGGDVGLMTGGLLGGLMGGDGDGIGNDGGVFEGLLGN